MTAEQHTRSKALLLIGSPKPGSGASRALGEHLLGLLAEMGMGTETVSLTKALRSAAATDALCAAVDDADIVVLSFPLYVDSLPGVTTQALEVIARHRAATSGDRRGNATPAFVAICQSGFPEQSQNLVALQICRNFARAAGFKWAGGLPMGAGGLANGGSLTELGGRVRNQVRALELTAAALCEGGQVPDEAVRSIGKMPIPKFVYRMTGEMGMMKQAKTAGVRAQIAARPFAGSRQQ